MRSLLLITLLAAGSALHAQNTAPAKAQASDAAAKPSKPKNPDLTPPHSGSVDAGSLSDEGDSSSKDTQIDISPPDGDDKAHPHSADILMDVEGASGDGNVREFHPWDPHKAMKNIEVGDFYFKRKNYRAAEDRYREALFYKDNDAIATYRLAVCLDKMDRPDEARQQYEGYLKILPSGSEAEASKKAIERLKGVTAKSGK